MKEFALISEKQVLYNIINLRQLVFEVTERCNLHCKYCGYAELYNDFENRKNRDMPFERAKAIIDYVQDWWENYPIKVTHKRVNISFYGGEPLVNIQLIKEIINYIEHLPDTGREFHYAMTTNGMLLEKHMDFLVEKDFQLLFSLDGDEYGDSYRTDIHGNSSFQRVYRNIKLLQAQYPDYFSKKTHFNSVLHNRNSVESIYEFIQKEFGKIPMIAEINPTDIRPEQWEEFKRMFTNMTESESKAKDPQLKEKLFTKSPSVKSLVNYIYVDSGNIYSSYTRLLLNKDSNHIVSGTCTPFSKKMFVTVEGKILSCERISHQFAFGEIQGSQVVLNFKEIAEKHNGYISAYRKQCEHCALGHKCSRCVYQMDETLTGSRYCTRFTTQEKLQENTQRVLSLLRENPHYYQKILKEVTLRQ